MLSQLFQWRQLANIHWFSKNWHLWFRKKNSYRAWNQCPAEIWQLRPSLFDTLDWEVLSHGQTRVVSFLSKDRGRYNSTPKFGKCSCLSRLRFDQYNRKPKYWALSEKWIPPTNAQIFIQFTNSDYNNYLLKSAVRLDAIFVIAVVLFFCYFITICNQFCLLF